MSDLEDVDVCSQEKERCISETLARFQSQSYLFFQPEHISTASTNSFLVQTLELCVLSTISAIIVSVWCSHNLWFCFADFCTSKKI